jgi:hypothetical protein
MKLLKGIMSRPLREILVLGHNDGPRREGVVRYRLVRRTGQTNVGDVLSPMACGRKPTRPRGRKLGIDKKAHQATRKTG